MYLKDKLLRAVSFQSTPATTEEKDAWLINWEKMSEFTYERMDGFKGFCPFEWTEDYLQIQKRLGKAKSPAELAWDIRRTAFKREKKAEVELSVLDDREMLIRLGRQKFSLEQITEILDDVYGRISRFRRYLRRVMLGRFVVLAAAVGLMGRAAFGLYLYTVTPQPHIAMLPNSYALWHDGQKIGGPAPIEKLQLPYLVIMSEDQGACALLLPATEPWRGCPPRPVVTP